MASDPSGPGGNADGAARGSLVDDVGRVVVVATLVLLVVNGGVGSVLARIAAGQVGADPSDYTSFAHLYVSTFLLSGTITAAIGAYGVPRIYGHSVHWLLPVGLVVVGAWVSGLGVHWPAGMGILGPFGGSLWMFAARYGASFLGGVVVGLTGGVIVVVAVERGRVRAAPPTGLVPAALPWTEGVAGVAALIVLASAFVWSNRPEVSFRDVIRLAGTQQQATSYRVDLNVRNLGREPFTLRWSAGSGVIGSVPIVAHTDGAWSTTVEVQNNDDLTFTVYGPEQLVVASTSTTSSATIGSVVSGPPTSRGYSFQLHIKGANLSGLNCHVEWRTVSDGETPTTLGTGAAALGQIPEGQYEYSGNILVSRPEDNGLPWHVVFTVVTSTGEPLASSADLPGAFVVQYAPGPQPSGNPQLYSIALTLELVNLKGRPCTVVWQTIYTDDGSEGDTSGSFIIGVTPNFGPMNAPAGAYLANLNVTIPNGARNGRPWRVAFKVVVDPGRTLLAAG